MFERYTEKARRTIFFARYEASTVGSPEIETEHLLLGLLRENAALSTRFFRSQTTPDVLRNEIARHRPSRRPFSTAVDIPLSHESKRALAYAVEEAEQLNHRHIGTEHLLLGLIRGRDTLAAKLLAQYGVTAELVRRDVRDSPPTPPPAPTHINVNPDQASTLGSFRLVLNVADLAASEQFYRKLGFLPVTDIHDLNSVVLANGGCVIALHQKLPPPSETVVDDGFAQHEVSTVFIQPDQGLRFESEDIAPVASRLQAVGIAFEKPLFTAPDGSASALLRDPDGNAIHLLSRKTLL